MKTEFEHDGDNGWYNTKTMEYEYSGDNPTIEHTLEHMFELTATVETELQNNSFNDLVGEKLVKNDPETANDIVINTLERVEGIIIHD